MHSVPQLENVLLLVDAAMPAVLLDISVCLWTWITSWQYSHNGKHAANCLCQKVPFVISPSLEVGQAASIACSIVSTQGLILLWVDGLDLHLCKVQFVGMQHAPSSSPYCLVDSPGPPPPSPHLSTPSSVIQGMHINAQPL